jgi:hypothetical protein
MEFFCEDLWQHGVLLVAPSSPNYLSLLADIQRRFDRPGDGSPPIPERFLPRVSEEDLTSAILVNNNQRAIAALWAVWQFETAMGRLYRHSRGMLSAQPLLLPFGAREEHLRILRYWNSILPGSKRYLNEEGMVGDNRDVRPPQADEKWSGGIMGVSSRAGGGHRADDPVVRVTLILDGVFFMDGEFIGPNREKLFEQTVAEFEAHTLLAGIARDCHVRGFTPEQVLAEIDNITGPVPEHPLLPPNIRNANATSQDFRQWALHRLARGFAMQRKSPQCSDEQIVHTVMGWDKATHPNFRRR